MRQSYSWCYKGTNRCTFDDKCAHGRWHWTGACFRENQQRSICGEREPCFERWWWGARLTKTRFEILSTFFYPIPPSADNQKGIIGTNYSRIIPSKEINSKDRDNFWKKEEEEERVRIRNELEKRKNEHLIQEQVWKDGLTVARNHCILTYHFLSSTRSSGNVSYANIRNASNSYWRQKPKKKWKLLSKRKPLSRSMLRFWTQNAVE